ncbi:MAG: fluoride efflux transporter CrcB [Firmicutes bacterium]|nr:fluoride efflux transporter CrcB [Bacillota bacterium]
MNIWANLGLVAVGGAIGASGRYLVGYLIPSPRFPIATFLINASGCLFIGILLGLASSPLLASSVKHLLRLTAVGVIGGYTTFSTYAFETVALLEEHRLAAAIGNVLGQTVLGLILVAAGSHTAHWLLNLRPGKEAFRD